MLQTWRFCNCATRRYLTNGANTVSLPNIYLYMYKAITINQSINQSIKSLCPLMSVLDKILQVGLTQALLHSSGERLVLQPYFGAYNV